MAKTGRNDPCPCGSGKKYKQCCFARDEAAAASARAAKFAAAPAPAPKPARFLQIRDDLDELTEASNAVIDLVHAGKIDEADKAAHDLLARFPDVHDGYDRLGMVCEARGQHRQAAEYYRKVLAVIAEHPETYDPEFADGYHKLIDRLDPPTAETTA